MNRRADLCADPAFNAAVLAVRRAGKAVTGAETSDADARLIALAALSAFARADGLTDPSIGRLMRYASNSAQRLSNASGQPVS
jgi:hypothetical protein